MTHLRTRKFVLGLSLIVLNVATAHASEPTATAAPTAINDPRPSLPRSRNQVDVVFESIGIEPVLNVALGPDPVVIEQNSRARFQAYWNYGPWIESAEIRIFRTDQSYADTPVKIIPVTERGIGIWKTGEDLLGEFVYVLRVTDEKGRYDETIPKIIKVIMPALRSSFQVVDLNDPAAFEEKPSALESVYGTDYTRSRNIQISGGMVTVHGREVEPGTTIMAFGREAPIDDEGKFVIQEIMAPGEHNVAIEFWKGEQLKRVLSREVMIPQSEIIYVVLGDLTVGRKLSNGPTNLLNPQEAELDETQVNGRAAFYARGKTKRGVEIIAQLDTGYEAVDDIFRNIDEKDPRYLLRRIDPGQSYPVYADDSTTTETTPTQGKFYLKIAKGESSLVWGNYATAINDTDLAQIERGLYGTRVKLVSSDTTKYGERIASLEAFAAEPGTLPAREEFRGTGGSVYFLQHQDLTIGSERLSVEIRDHESGLVRETIDLAPREDYDINYIQGRVLLSNPLASYATDNFFVRDGTLAGHDVHLVVHYEFTPGLSKLEGWSTGGRASAWLGDYFQVGMTAYDEGTSGADQQLYAADMTLRASPNTYLRAEFARTEGPGFDTTTSNDGGFNYTSESVGPTPGRANAYRLESRIDARDLPWDLRADAFTVNSYFEHRDKSLSSLGRMTQVDTNQWGVEFKAHPAEGMTMRGAYDEIEKDDGLRARDVAFDVEQDLSQHWSLGAGYRHEQDKPSFIGPPTARTKRDDVAVQVKYDTHRRFSMYAFGQNTIRNEGDVVLNERGGGGFEYAVGERVKLGAEVSGGDGGLGSQVKGSYHQDDGTDFYLGYQIDPLRSNTGSGTLSPFEVSNGTLTVGSRQRFGDSMSVYGEERYQHGTGTTGVTHSYGIDFHPTEHWQLGYTMETGRIELAGGSAMDRDAYSVTLGYKDDYIAFATNVESRNEQSTLEERETRLVRSLIDFNGFDDWRLTSRVNWMQSDSDLGDFFDGEFTEATVGFGYRPVLNDRLNILSKYTLLYDLPSAQQVTPSGLTADYKQRSHIFAFDVMYDVNERLTLGAKYGVRVGEITTSRISDDFYSATAHLAVARLDWHVVKKWDFLMEQRFLYENETNDYRTGSLVALYRHFGNNYKVGLGYNFADFSDKLTNTTYDDSGLFLNFVAKY